MLDDRLMSNSRELAKKAIERVTQAQDDSPSGIELLKNALSSLCKLDDMEVKGSSQRGYGLDMYMVDGANSGRRMMPRNADGTFSGYGYPIYSGYSGNNYGGNGYSGNGYSGNGYSGNGSYQGGNSGDMASLMERLARDPNYNGDRDALDQMRRTMMR